jgi:hypothetical protein
MSLWRRHALDVLPELRREIISTDVDSIYALWRELFSLAGKAVDEDDGDLLRRIMEYALWCYHHHSHDVSNAVCVVFYEHLGGNLKVAYTAKAFIPNYVVAAVWGLWENSLSESEMPSLPFRAAPR